MLRMQLSRQQPSLSKAKVVLGPGPPYHQNQRRRTVMVILSPCLTVVPQMIVSFLKKGQLMPTRLMLLMKGWTGRSRST